MDMKRDPTESWFYNPMAFNEGDEKTTFITPRSLTPSEIARPKTNVVARAWEALRALGSSASGNFGHAGRPGQRGGSAPRGGSTPPSQPSAPPSIEVLREQARESMKKGDPAALKKVVSRLHQEHVAKTATIRTRIGVINEQLDAMKKISYNKLFNLQWAAAKAVEEWRGGVDAEGYRERLKDILTPQERFPELLSLTSLAEAEALHEKATSEYRAYDEKRDALWAEKHKLVKEMEEARAVVDKEINNALRQPPPQSDAATKFIDTSSVRLKAEHMEAVKWVTEIADVRALTDTIMVKRTESSSSSWWAGIIELSYGADAGTLVHEIGHHIHQSFPTHEMRDKVTEFFNRRTEGSPIVSADTYGKGTKIKHGKFMDVYAGRVYTWEGTKSTGREIVSVGLEKMYRCPARFYEADPEHFELILDVLAHSRKVTAS